MRQKCTLWKDIQALHCELGPLFGSMYKYLDSESWLSVSLKHVGVGEAFLFLNKKKAWY